MINAYTRSVSEFLSLTQKLSSSHKSSLTLVNLLSNIQKSCTICVRRSLSLSPLSLSLSPLSLSPLSLSLRSLSLRSLSLSALSLSALSLSALSLSPLSLSLSLSRPIILDGLAGPGCSCRCWLGCGCHARASFGSKSGRGGRGIWFKHIMYTSMRGHDCCTCLCLPVLASLSTVPFSFLGPGIGRCTFHVERVNDENKFRENITSAHDMVTLPNILISKIEINQRNDIFFDRNHVWDKLMDMYEYGCGCLIDVVGQGFDLRILAVLALPLFAVSWALFNVTWHQQCHVEKLNQSTSKSSKSSNLGRCGEWPSDKWFVLVRVPRCGGSTPLGFFLDYLIEE